MKKQSTENVLPKNQWWANGNIICNVHDNILVSNPTTTTTTNTTTTGNNKGHNSDPTSTTSNLRQSQYWGDHFLFQLKDMFSEVCNSNRYIPDCDFFINKRDYPQLKYNDILGMYAMLNKYYIIHATVDLILLLYLDTVYLSLP